jgi:hypothetical protein
MIGICLIKGANAGADPAMMPVPDSTIDQIAIFAIP